MYIMYYMYNVHVVLNKCLYIYVYILIGKHSLYPQNDNSSLAEALHTVGQFLIAWFNDCVLGKLGRIANPVISTPYCIIVHAYVYIYVCKSINCESRENSLFAINKYS